MFFLGEKKMSSKLFKREVEERESLRGVCTGLGLEG